MAITFLKKAQKSPETEAGNAQSVAAGMLAEIERRGEEAVREYAAKLDRWEGDIVVPAAEIERRAKLVPDTVKADIEFATAQVRRFAKAQRESIQAFEVEVHPGLVAGQRIVPGRIGDVLSKHDDARIAAHLVSHARVEEIDHRRRLPHGTGFGRKRRRRRVDTGRVDEIHCRRRLGDQAGHDGRR